MVVLKFGGTSVGSARGIRQILAILQDDAHRGRTAAVVVSALTGVTDGLIALVHRAAAKEDAAAEIQSLRARHEALAVEFLPKPEAALAELDAALGELGRILEGVSIVGEISKRVLDFVMSFGERVSAALLARIFSANGVEAEFLDARQVILTNDNFGAAAYFQDETYSRIRAALEGKTALQVVTGFIASSRSGATTTLGRGGSDLSAAIFGAAIGAESVEIWTDVDGIMTADPRLVPNAFRIDSISYEEALELAHFGAKVLHPPTVKPALERGIPIRIKNTFNPESHGTLIVQEAVASPYQIRGVSALRDIALVRVQGSGMVGLLGFSSRLFGALAERGINIIMITQASSEYSICFALLPSCTSLAVEAIEAEFHGEIASGAIERPFIEEDMSVVAVVGAKMKRVSGVAGKVFHALGRNGINIVAIAQGSSELNISLVIKKADTAKAVNAIHQAFFLSGVRYVNLFLVGAGLIGGTLLDQLARQQEILAARHKIAVKLIAVANSRRMYFDPEGLAPGRARELLEGGEPLNLSEFIERMRRLNLPNTAFCDCTASSTVAGTYSEILRSLIPVITPNKRANSGPYDYYRLITDFSHDRGIPYLYETTVCAGLPVISTLRDLYLSGDKVRRIEAVLSGTLSFIFNNFDGSKPFSALVREAKERGYTEPDPRDDLNAMDAARKALVLARECGMALEFDQVDIEPILPEACFKAADVQAFFTELEKYDGDFEKKLREAASGGKSLRYIALIESGSAKLALRAEGPGSPFLSLVDADNVVVITTDRYSRLPLVVKGPGAGAEVTAGGVFADIVRIARTLV